MRHVMGLFLLLGLGAAAQAQEVRGVYAGLSFGSFGYEEDGANLGFPISDRASAYRVVGGYQFNSVYALEAGWGVSGEVGERLDGFDPSGGNASLEVSAEYEIVTLRFLALAPFSDINMFGGAGYYDATAKASLRFRSSVEQFTASDEFESDGFTVVGGVQYDFERFSIRGEYEWFDADDVEVQSFSITGLFRF